MSAGRIVFNCQLIFKMNVFYVHIVPALGDAGPNAGLCKTYSVLLCVLKQPRVVDSSAEPFKRGVKLRARDPIVLRPF
jgi:hypothetical protein